MSLETVGIGGTVETIETKAFANCENLERAVISDSVTEIANDAFINCPKLTIYCTENSYAHLYASANGIRVTTLVIDPIPNQTYTGKAITPELGVSCSGSRLEKGTEYTAVYSNNINAGTATVTISGKGEFDMLTSKAQFVIMTKDISSADISVSSIPDQKYTGEEVTPKITVKRNGKVLTEGKDYSLNYINNKAIGTAKIMVRGIGNYSGSTVVTFEIKEMSPVQAFISRLLSMFLNLFAMLFSRV